MATKRSTYAAVHILTLPSGKKVQVRRPSALSLIASGGFPASLTAQVMKLIDRNSIDTEKDTDPESVMKWAALMDAYLKHVFVSPSIIADSPSDVQENEAGLLSGTLNVQDIPDLDKQTLFYYGTGLLKSDDEKEAEATVKALEPFRDGAKRADVGPGSAEVRAASVEHSGTAAG